ncbi:MAG: hypothetical protein FWG98_10160 [Candidatus Cloacimonetes bacterium]|nr:hypothetical protein [Candidatus Cloacimonadota bacterium]
MDNGEWRMENGEWITLISGKSTLNKLLIYLTHPEGDVAFNRNDNKYKSHPEGVGH